MAKIIDLLPDLCSWNNGTGIKPDDWIYIDGRADHALGFCSLLWPEFIEIDGYVLRAPLDEARLRDWAKAGYSRQQVETAMNAFLFDGIFPDDRAEPSLKRAQL